ncbi:hypothetical protein [Natrialba taiwanensis]|uniref:hypothetical protein n=1 Tax=Natrialba taiwanensis TaxID=160846 RepID=UPI000677CB4D|nr:hypothetical protein [Natrialba taiwanensis]
MAAETEELPSDYSPDRSLGSTLVYPIGILGAFFFLLQGQILLFVAAIIVTYVLALRLST